MNRREWMAAGSLALLAGTHLPRAFAAQQDSGPGIGNTIGENNPPKILLSSIFTPELLTKSLASASAWHPYPKAGERSAWQNVPRDVAGALIRRGNAIRGTEWLSLPAQVFLEFQRIGNRSHYEALYFGRRARLSDLVLAECVEGKGRFLDEIVNGVWLVCEETSWSIPASIGMQRDQSGLPDVTEPVIELFAAQTSGMLAWIHYLLEAKLDEISPLIARRIQIEAKRRILDPALERNDFFWMWGDAQGKLNNWNPWINSNWMATNLLLEQDSTRRLEAMSKIVKSLDRYLAGYSPDGGCEEGLRYWGVSAAAYFDCCTMLASATGVTNVLRHPFLREMEHYIADVHIARKYYANYGDANVNEGPLPELVYRMGSSSGDVTLKAFGAFSVHAGATIGSGEEGRLDRALPDLLSVAEARSAEKADALERGAWYPALGLMTARTKAGTSDGFYLAVQAAPNLRPHGHNDSGSFIIFHDGEPVFIDVGVETYSAKTFSADRYTIWSMQSAYHNLPTVGGVMQSGSDAKYRASELRYLNDETHVGLSMNLATAYPDDAGITHWTRVITLDRKAGRVLLSEDFQLQRKAPVALSFMTSRIPTVHPKGSVTLRAAARPSRDVALNFDGVKLVATFEKIELKDDFLKRAWGNAIYRVLLSSAGPVDSGQWTMDIV